MRASWRRVESLALVLLLGAAVTPWGCSERSNAEDMGDLAIVDLSSTTDASEEPDLSSSDVTSPGSVRITSIGLAGISNGNTTVTGDADGVDDAEWSVTLLLGVGPVPADPGPGTSASWDVPVDSVDPGATSDVAAYRITLDPP